MTGLTSQLAELEDLLRDLQAPLIGHLRPPAGSAAVDAALESAGARPHPDVTAWYGWHDGSDAPAAVDPPGHLLPDVTNRLIGGLHLLTLDQAVQHWRAAVVAEPFGDRRLFTRPGWFPVLAFTDAWLVCLDTTEQAGSLYVWDVHAGYDIDTLEPWAPSLGGLVAGVVDAYRSGHASPARLVLDFSRLPPTAQLLRY